MGSWLWDVVIRIGEVLPRASVLYGLKLLSEALSMATRRYNIPINQEICERYASDLSDQEFELVAPHVAQKSGLSLTSSSMSQTVSGGSRGILCATHCDG